MSELRKLPNVGKVLEENLLAIGVMTPEQLREMGSEKAFVAIRLQVDAGACIHMLYGIEGAIQGKNDQDLSLKEKERLKKFYHSLN